MNQDLIPVHKLKSVISQIIEGEKGDTIGYNRAFICKEKTKVGVVPIGHADGVNRSFSKNLYVSVNGKRAKVIGNICMDVLMINVTTINVDEGDEVIIFDEKNNAEALAKSAGTISYEILTNLSQRICRKVIG